MSAKSTTAAMVVFGVLIHLGHRSGITTQLVLLRGKTQEWPKLHFMVTMLLIQKSSSAWAITGDSEVAKPGLF